MAFSKADQYELTDQRSNELLKAISYPARQKILKQLNQQGRCNVKELSKNHPISKPAMSYHLEILRTAHLIIWEEKFPHTYYELNWEVIAEAKALFIHFFDGFEKKDGDEIPGVGETKYDSEEKR